MALTTLVAHLEYDSGAMYRLGIEDATDKVHLYWQEDQTDSDTDGAATHWQCFVQYDAIDSEGTPRSDTALIKQAKDLISSHRLEPDGTFQRAI